MWYSLVSSLYASYQLSWRAGAEPDQPRSVMSAVAGIDATLALDSRGTGAQSPTIKSAGLSTNHNPWPLTPDIVLF